MTSRVAENFPTTPEEIATFEWSSKACQKTGATERKQLALQRGQIYVLPDLCPQHLSIKNHVDKRLKTCTCTQIVISKIHCNTMALASYDESLKLYRNMNDRLIYETNKIH